jgi:D-sedoheptulose 7-phosphate isomerase
MTEPTPRAAVATTSQRITDRATAHEALLDALARPDAAQAIDGAGAAIADALTAEGTAYFFGNGGSAADAQHLVAELVGRFRDERRPLAAVALGTNPAVASALGNDYGFAEAGLARELDALGHSGDVAVALSTSGRSPNVLAALDVARQRGMRTVALVGEGHALTGQVDHLIVVGTANVALVQEIHSVIGHLLCEIVEDRLDLG